MRRFASIKPPLEEKFGAAKLFAKCRQTIHVAEADNPRYDTNEQYVGNDYKGVVIVNGKKKVIK